MLRLLLVVLLVTAPCSITLAYDTGAVKYVPEAMAAPAPEPLAASITFPQANRVFQQSGGTGTIPVSWRGDADLARLKLNGNTIAETGAAASNGFPSSFTVAPGWYDLVLVKDGVEGDAIKVGIGDVYLVAGQSNSVSQVQPQGYAPIVPPPGRVIVSDYYTAGQGMNAFRDPAVKPLTMHLYDAGVAWLYCGLALNRSYPVMFVIIGQGNTSTADWRTTPFLKRMFEGVYSYRPKAILWLQGEYDAMSGWSQATTYSNLHAIVWNMRQIDATPWVIAINSKPGGYAPTRAAEQQVIDEIDSALLGPDTDQYRNGNVEFQGADLQSVGEAFAARLLALGL